MAKTKMPKTPLLDELESGPWPSTVAGLKRLAGSEDKHYADRMKSLLSQLEYSYKTRLGYWKGGAVGVRGYGGGVIPRYSELPEKFPDSAEFHTLRVMPPAGFHYDTKTLRKLSDIWEEHGSGLITFHGQSGDIMFQGCTTDEVQTSFDALNEYGFDMGGAGPGLRSSASCVGHARCEHSCYDEVRAHRMIIDQFLDEMHRPSLPYKFKFKFSGCANDCTNAIQRSDFAIYGTWRDDIQVDQEEVQNYVKERGRKWLIDNIITRCPTRALSVNDDDSLEIDNQSCVRCMHCINCMTKALSPGKERGVTICVGGHRTLKIGDTMGTVIVPFMKLESDEDFEALSDIAQKVMDFFIDNALERERIGEMIIRIGLSEFLDGLGLEAEPNMVAHPRTSSYFKADGWDEEVEKWKKRQSEAAD